MEEPSLCQQPIDRGDLPSTVASAWQFPVRVCIWLWAVQFVTTSMHWQAHLDSYIVGWPVVYLEIDPWTPHIELDWRKLCMALALWALVAFLLSIASSVIGWGWRHAAAKWPRLAIVVSDTSLSDVRRFSRLPHEMLSRIAGSVVVGLGLLGFVAFTRLFWDRLSYHDGFNSLIYRSWGHFFPVALFAPLVTAFAKKGRRPLLLALGAATFAYIVAALGYHLAARGDYDSAFVMSFVVKFGVVSTAMATVEGMLERSIATTYAGILLGALAGGGAAAVFLAFAAPTHLFGGGIVMNDASVNWAAHAIMLVGSIMVMQVGIGLSLALGRRLRDLSKREDNGQPIR